MEEGVSFAAVFKYKRGRRFRGFVCRAFNSSEGLLAFGDIPIRCGVLFLVYPRSLRRLFEVLSKIIDYPTLESRLARLFVAFNVMDNIIVEVFQARSDSSLLFCYKRGDQVTSWLTSSPIPSFYSSNMLKLYSIQ